MLSGLVRLNKQLFRCLFTQAIQVLVKIIFTFCLPKIVSEKERDFYRFENLIPSSSHRESLFNRLAQDGLKSAKESRLHAPSRANFKSLIETFFRLIKPDK